MGSDHEQVQLGPERCRRQACAFDKSAQFGPGQIDVDPAADAAIRPSYDVFAADDLGVTPDAIGDKQRVLPFDDGVTQ